MINADVHNARQGCQQRQRQGQASNYNRCLRQKGITKTLLRIGKR
jgi:hypothetical protein